MGLIVKIIDNLQYHENNDFVFIETDFIPFIRNLVMKKVMKTLSTGNRLKQVMDSTVIIDNLVENIGTFATSGH